MKRTWRRFWRRRPRGVTLVEALAGSALLGSLLVALLIAEARLNAQARRSHALIEACDVADRTLEGLWERKEGFPRQESGEVAGREGWRWRTSRIDGDLPSDFDMEKVAFELFEPGEDEKCAVRVELILPKEPLDAEAKAESDDVD